MKENSNLQSPREFQIDQTLSDEKGQSLIEFVFLMASIVIISFTMLRGFHGGIKQMWKGYVTAIAQPTDSPIEYP